MAALINKQLLEALGRVDRPQSFCVHSQLPPVLPGLEVAGIGQISLPLTKAQAAALKRRAHQAPYGKGTQTIVDTDVRRVWEIDADQVSLTNPQWLAILQQTISTIQSELGLENQKLKAHLYKLLLYEPGSFFLSHRDGEKLDRMVGTLVIVLPSMHEGGELVIRHDGREETIDFGGPDSRFITRYAAFYADCEHEIRPVNSGFRLTLVYNLALEKSKRRITAPSSRTHVEAVSDPLSKWTSKQPAQKLAVLLDHKYTKAGLTLDALKGIDRAKANILFDAARQAGCDAHLALVTLWEAGSAEPTYDYDRYRRRRYEDDIEEDDDEYAMGDVFDRSLIAEQFTDAAGDRVSFGEIPLEDDEIVSARPLSESKPDEEEFEGYTGNAGMTLDRWYHRAAVVLWPAAARFEVLCSAGVESAVGGLEQMIGRWLKAGKDEKTSLHEQCLAFAKQIIADWPSREFADSYSSERKDECPDLLLLLQKLGDKKLIAHWIRNVFGRDVSIDPGKTLGDICQKHGWLTFQSDLQRIFERTTNETIERNARLVADWCLRKDSDADRRELCKPLLHNVVDTLVQLDTNEAKNDWRARKINRSKLLPPLVQACLALEEKQLHQRLVDHVLSLPKKYNLTKTQIPALVRISPWLKRKLKRPSPPLNAWLKAVHRELEHRATNPPLEPSDWRRDSLIPCTCADCKQLSRFLHDAHEKILRLPLAEQRRRHLHQIIDGNKLDLTHVTERRGRPYTLVCTKTTGTYKRKLKAHQVDLKHLDIVQGLVDWHSGLKQAAVRG
jgi:hypothetical protein